MHSNLAIKYLLILPLLTLAVWLRYQSIKQPLRYFFYPALIWKLLLGVLLGIVYQNYYVSGDTFNLFQNAQKLVIYLPKNPVGFLEVLCSGKFQVDFLWLNDSYWQQPRSLFTVRLLSIINLLTGNSYWMTSLYLSFFSFWSMWSLANQLVKMFPKTYYAALFAFLFYPSVVFWSSGISKECLFWIPFGFALNKFLQLINGEIKSKRQYLLTFFIFSITCFLGYYLKFYYIVVCVPCILAYWVVMRLSQYWKWKYSFVKLGLLVGCFLVFSIVASFTHPAIHPNRVMDRLVRNHNANYHFSEFNDVIHFKKVDRIGYYNLHSSLRSLGFNIPLAFYSGLFRPLPWDVKENFISLKGLVSLENIFVLILILLSALVFFQKKQLVKIDLLLVTCILYVFILATLLAFAAPNFGTLARYKVGFMPFFIYIISLPLSEKIRLVINNKKGRIKYFLLKHILVIF